MLASDAAGTSGQPLRRMSRRERRFHELVGQHSGYLYRYAYWLCNNAAQAEDLVQETFLRAWRALDQIQDEKAAKSWLTTIVRRENARLYQRNRPEYNAEPLPDTLVDERAGIVDPDSHVLHAALEKLPAKFREPLLLQVVCGHSCAEIADILGLTAGAVTTRVFRAREKMRGALSGTYSDIDATTQRTQGPQVRLVANG